MKKPSYFILHTSYFILLSIALPTALTDHLIGLGAAVLLHALAVQGIRQGMKD